MYKILLSEPLSITLIWWMILIWGLSKHICAINVIIKCVESLPHVSGHARNTQFFKLLLYFIRNVYRIPFINFITMQYLRLNIIFVVNLYILYIRSAKVLLTQLDHFYIFKAFFPKNFGSLLKSYFRFTLKV